MLTTSAAMSPLRLLAYAAPAAIVLLMLPHVASPYQRILMAYGLIMAIAALGFNLLLGYTGLLSFGHSAYFGLGAYAVAFMVKYLQVTSMEAFVIGGVIATLLVTAVFGVICVRYTRIFFAILTMALSQVLWSLAYKFFWVTGGSDGLRIPTPTILNGLLTVPKNKIAFLSFTYYYYVLLVFFVCVVLMWVIVHSPFGQSLQAIRDNETRAAFLGVRVRRARWIAFMISGGFTGVAGILWAPLNGLTTPDILYWPFSGEIVFLTVLGGFGTFSGPIIGAIAFNYLKTYAIGLTVYWQLLLGAVLIVLVLALPTGIMGTLTQLTLKIRSVSPK